MLIQPQAMNHRDDNAEMDSSLSRRQSGHRDSILSRSSRLEVSAFDEATIAKASNEINKDITVQNEHSRHSLPDLSSTCEAPSSSKHETWYFSSNHVLVNQERVEKGLSPLHRSRDLDEKARDLAKVSASKCKLKKIPKTLKGNVFRGTTIREIHYDMMVKEGREQKKILSKKYNTFGMGTHKGDDGFLYLVQLFEKNRIDQ
mmetsp:Transcript_25216/g.62137  ORF Transcript_25216/g.62137 Transcript_25216/m.62137 type:complete len:202 (-) Transcript_25216:99-704(-)